MQHDIQQSSWRMWRLIVSDPHPTHVTFRCVRNAFAVVAVVRSGPLRMEWAKNQPNLALKLFTKCAAHEIGRTCVRLVCVCVCVCIAFVYVCVHMCASCVCVCVGSDSVCVDNMCVRVCVFVCCARVRSCDAQTLSLSPTPSPSRPGIRQLDTTVKAAYRPRASKHVMLWFALGTDPAFGSQPQRESVPRMEAAWIRPPKTLLTCLTGFASSTHARERLRYFVNQQIPFQDFKSFFA